MLNSSAARLSRTMRIVHQTLPYNLAPGAELEQNYWVTAKSKGNLPFPFPIDVATTRPIRKP